MATAEDASAGWPTPAAELASVEPLAGRLALARRHIDDVEGPERVSAALRYATLAALAGESDEAEVGLKYARDVGGGSRGVNVEVVTAFVVLRGGDPTRTLGAIQRADQADDGTAPETWRHLRQVLRAGALVLLSRHQEAAAAITRALTTMPQATRHGPIGVLARVTAADAAVGLGRRDEALEYLSLTVDHEGRAGLLECIVGLAEARAHLGDRNCDPTVPRAALSQAAWRLVSLGAPRELGVCYLLMARVEAVAGADEAVPAGWLARAHAQLQKAGTPRDLEALRVAFRAYGRRAVDRLVDADMATRIDQLRQKRAALRDVLAARADVHDAVAVDLGDGDALDEAAIAGALDELVASEEHLVGVLESLVVDRERMGHLIQISRRIMPLELMEDVVIAIPRLAHELSNADGVALFERDAGGSLEVLARHGQGFTQERRLARDVHDVLETGIPRLLSRQEGDSNRPPTATGDAPRTAPRTAHRVALVPIHTERQDLVLVVQRRSGALTEQDLERLTVFGSLAAASLVRARGAGALRAAASRSTATLEAIRDGVVSLGRDGVVRGVNQAAARMFGLARDVVVGQVLRDVEGLLQLSECMLSGADVENDVVSLPNMEVLVRTRSHEGGTVATLQERRSAQRLAQKLVGSGARFTFDDLVGDAKSFVASLDDARRAASSDVSILVTGESGTGKEMLAQAIHNGSTRASAPFVGINVAAIPRELLESELFGYERGAFTGARAGGLAGKFELAEAGTLLLDEIGEMSYEMQAKLLRVLQERTVQRLGGTREIAIRARVIATTHRNLEQAVKDGTFRLDLFYRLRVVHLRLPPLRERREDIPSLIEHHLARFGERVGRPPVDVSAAVLERLIAYDWPGNVRELANLVDGEASLLPLDKTRLSRIPRALERAEQGSSSSVTTSASGGLVPGPADEVLPLAEIERRTFQHALERHDGNIAKAAKALGVARGTFYNKIRRYGLDH